MRWTWHSPRPQLPKRYRSLAACAMTSWWSLGESVYRKVKSLLSDGDRIEKWFLASSRFLHASRSKRAFLLNGGRVAGLWMPPERSSRSKPGLSRPTCGGMKTLRHLRHLRHGRQGKRTQATDRAETFQDPTSSASLRPGNEPRRTFRLRPPRGPASFASSASPDSPDSPDLEDQRPPTQRFCAGSVFSDTASRPYVA